MLLHRLIHPEINRILGRAGHHAKILIADGHYPASTTLGPNAELIHLNLAPNLLTCAQVLEVILSAVPIDEINTMMYESTDPYGLTEDPKAWNDFRKIIRGAGLQFDLKPIPKWDFYKVVNTPDHVLTIQTGDTERFTNLLLSIGVRLD
ncbi:MAG: transporter [Gemmataceae bacterium]|nr:transporter [Gemmataceae bacterium]